MNMTEQAAIIYEEMTGMAEASAALMLEERDVDLFISNASPRKLMRVAQYMRVRIYLLSRQHNSIHLDEAWDLAAALALDLEGAILDIKGAAK